jgi:hypothetical protein
MAGRTEDCEHCCHEPGSVTMESGGLEHWLCEGCAENELHWPRTYGELHS